MAMLDLQSMVTPAPKEKGPPSGSRASKGCSVPPGPGSPPDNQSTLSVAICAF